MQKLKDIGRRKSLRELIESIEEPFEFINGEVYLMSPPFPTVSHAKTISFLTTTISNYFERIGSNCEVFSAPLDVYLNEDSKDEPDVVQPDVFVVCDSSQSDGKRIHGAPDLVVEVISPSNKDHDYITKLDLYRKAGVKEYWILDFEANQVRVYNFPDPGYRAATFEDTVESRLFPDLRIDFGKIQKKLARWI